MAILQPANGIFYHPLDNSTEFLKSQAWTSAGGAGFVAGKIGSGISAMASSAPAWGTVATATTVGVLCEHISTVAMDSTHFVALYNHKNTNIRARAGLVSGTDITYGNEVTITATPTDNWIIGAKLTSTSLIAVKQGDNTGQGRGFILTLSGLNLTVGPVHEFETFTQQTYVIALSSTTAVVFFRRFNIGGNGQARVATISGTDITYGPPFEFTTAVNMSGDQSDFDSIKAVTLDSTHFVVQYTDTPSGGQGKARVATVSGTDITYGPVGQWASSTGKSMNIIALTSSKVVVGYRDGVIHNAKVGTISGTDITFGSSFSFGPTNGTEQQLIDLGDSTHFIAMTGASSANSFHATVSGTDVTYSSGGTVASEVMDSPTGAALSSTKFVATYTLSNHTHVKNVVGDFLPATATLTASTPAAYSSTIGATRVVTALWAKNLSLSAATATLERGYSVLIDSSSISLGGTTAVWSGAGIVSLLGTGAGEMNDGVEHLLVLDFEHAGGTNWTLRTSVDGAAFTDQGTQSSGTQAVTTVDTDPEIALDNLGGEDQWVDEAVLWAGDKSLFALFTTSELANLYDLGDTFGDSMDQYEENFGAPICWQATAKMPDGTVWRDSGSGPCPSVIRVPSGAADIVVTDDGLTAHPRIQEG